jgi:hypothetical protein
MYMGDKMTSSKHTLAVTLGHPAHTRHGEDDEVEAQRRIRDTYQKIIPEWDPNDVSCHGQKVCHVSATAVLAQSVVMKCFAIYASCFRAFVRVD